MQLRAKIAILAATAVAAVLASGALAADDPYHLKPGARGKLCVGCHTDFEDVLKLPSVHTPVREGDCADCHSPHASSHGKLLAADPDRICAECHSTMIPEDAKSVHAAVVAGNCVACHDPHGSKNANNLLRAGNDLCAGCHEDVVKGATTAAVKHAPVEKSCLTCHDPHASAAAPALLRKPTTDLCTGCHKPDRPSFAAQHMNYPVTKGNCTSCHDPHGSKNRGLLWATVHPPVADKLCSQCHEDASSPNALRTKRTGIALCRGCHGEMVAETFSKNRVHWPVVDEKACLNCHNPHASREPALVKAPLAETCGGCHRDTMERQARSLTKHEPIQQGECTTCHSPHSGDAPFLFTDSNVIDLCGTCHDWQRHSSHPIGEKAVDPRNPNLTLDCLSCHRSHGSPYKAFMQFDSKMELCVQCHQQFQR